MILYAQIPERSCHTKAWEILPFYEETFLDKAIFMNPRVYFQTHAFYSRALLLDGGLVVARLCNDTLARRHQDYPRVAKGRSPHFVIFWVLEHTYSRAAANL
mmetsp:Transcript_3486/g.6129  ORF Transcript_3486/g.6129 Transcript_3486/m.6129 type:complete len:102 (+) Transcript_3486:493-798(+)